MVQGRLHDGTVSLGHLVGHRNALVESVGLVVEPNLRICRHRFLFGGLLEVFQYFFDHSIRCDAVFVSKDWDTAMLDKLIGPTDAFDGRVNTLAV